MSLEGVRRSSYNRAKNTQIEGNNLKGGSKGISGARHRYQQPIFITNEASEDSAQKSTRKQRPVYRVIAGNAQKLGDSPASTQKTEEDTPTENYYQQSSGDSLPKRVRFKNSAENSIITAYDYTKTKSDTSTELNSSYHRPNMSSREYQHNDYVSSQEWQGRKYYRKANDGLYRLNRQPYNDGWQKQNDSEDSKTPLSKEEIKSIESSTSLFNKNIILNKFQGHSGKSSII